MEMLSADLYVKEFFKRNCYIASTNSKTLREAKLRTEHIRKRLVETLSCCYGDHHQKPLRKQKRHGLKGGRNFLVICCNFKQFNAISGSTTYHGDVINSRVDSPPTK
jgi:hypothetical protein